MHRDGFPGLRARAGPRAPRPALARARAVDLLSELVEHLRLQCRPPVVHDFEGPWAVAVPAGTPALHLVRAGKCQVWAPTARHSMTLAEGSLLLVSGTTPWTLQARGPRLDAGSSFDWATGRVFRAARALPVNPSAVQLVSARVQLSERPGVLQTLPEMVVVGGRQSALPRSYRPILDGLLEELSMPRMGSAATVRLLLQVLAIQALRIHLTTGWGSLQGWLGALSDPVLRTCLEEQEELPTRDPARSLASTSGRSTRRLSARVRTSAGTGPRGIAQQRRIQRVLQLLEDGVHPLGRVAQEAGFASVSPARTGDACNGDGYPGPGRAPRAPSSPEGPATLSARGSGPRSRPTPAWAPQRSG